MYIIPNSGFQNFRIISIVVFVFILRPSESSADTYLEQFVASIHEYIHSGCIILLQNGHPSLSTMSFIVRLHILLKNVPVFPVLPSQIGRMAVKCHPRRLLIVALSTNAELLAEMNIGDQKLTPSTWLLLLERGNDLDIFFENVDVPFNSEVLVAQPKGRHLVVLTEVYRVESRHPLQKDHFGSWTRGQGVLGPTTSFYQRRKNLQGIAFRVVLKETVAISTEINEHGDIVNISGYFGVVWKILEKELNFSSNFYFPEDGHYGILLGNGTWNGMIGEVQRQEAHFCCASISLNADRNDAVDFLSTLIGVRTSFVIKEPTEVLVTWQEFLKPFTWQLWLALVMCMLLIASCFLIVSSFHGHNNEEKSGHVADAVFNVVSIFTLKGEFGIPASLSARTVSWISHFTATILLAGYSACLISHLTTKKMKMPFSTLREFLDSNTYQLGAMPFSAFSDFFKNSSDPDMREMDTRFISGHEASAPRTDIEGLRRVCKLKYYAYLTYTEIMSHTPKECNAIVVPHLYFPGSIAFITNKRSPYRKLFNMKIHDLRCSGILKRLHQVFFSLQGTSEDMPLPVVDFSDIKSIFAVLFVAVLISVLLLLCERTGPT